MRVLKFLRGAYTLICPDPLASDLLNATPKLNANNHHPAVSKHKHMNPLIAYSLPFRSVGVVKERFLNVLQQGSDPPQCHRKTSADSEL